MHPSITIVGGKHGQPVVYLAGNGPDRYGKRVGKIVIVGTKGSYGFAYKPNRKPPGKKFATVEAVKRSLTVSVISV